MEKSLKKVKINVGKGSWIFEFNYVPLNNNRLKIQPLFEQAEYGLLIERKHESPQSELILTGTPSCWILSFNENGLLSTVTKYINDGSNRRVSYWKPQLYMVLLSITTTLRVMMIDSLEIMEDKPATAYKTPQIAILTLDEGGAYDVNLGGKKFPYIITRIMPTLYKKTFIRFDFELRNKMGSVIYVNPNILPKGKSLKFLLESGFLDERLKELTVSFASNNIGQGICLVISEKRCFYYENNTFTETDQLPCGGTLIVGSKQIDIPNMGTHY